MGLVSFLIVDKYYNGKTESLQNKGHTILLSSVMLLIGCS
jgi:hypothetical protein